MPVILVTNDDGINSPGLASLYDAMKELGSTYIVAPDRDRSAVSHSLTMHRPLKVEKIGSRKYSVNGTPTDWERHSCGVRPTTSLHWPPRLCSTST